MPFQNFAVSKITDTGDAVMAAISPDGKYILSITRNGGLGSLWLRNVPTNSNTQVQPPADVYYGGLRFSRDGNYFYFVRSDPGNPELKFLYRAPLLGGVAQKLVSDVDSNITFSPDGQQFAFIRCRQSGSRKVSPDHSIGERRRRKNRDRRLAVGRLVPARLVAGWQDYRV